MQYDRERIAENLRRLRREKAVREDRIVSQREVAASCGVSEATILNYENGSSSMGFKTAWRIADFYGVTLDELGSRSE